MKRVDELPDYAPMLSAYHRAFAPELRTMVDNLPIRNGDRILEIACGDGAYTGWLAERAGVDGSVTALDVSSAYLEIAQNGNGHHAANIDFVSSTIENMPFDDNTFDLTWCAQSLYSLADPVESVRLMRRVARPGGVLAVLENDTLHHILLPWPVEVELEVRRAEFLGFIDESKRPRKFYVGRQLREVFRQAGLENCRTQTYVTNRHAPLGAAERAFLEAHIAELQERCRPHLKPAMAEWFDRLSDPCSPVYILDNPDLTVTCIDHVVCGTKPA